MKKAYRIACIHRDKKFDSLSRYSYVIAPLYKGLNAIQEHLDNNTYFEGRVEFLVQEMVDEEKAIFILKGKKKHIQEAIHSLLCNTNLSIYFNIEERGGY